MDNSVSCEEAAKDFLVFIEATKAAKTHAYYKCQLTTLLRWMGGRDMSLSEFKVRNLREYLLERRKDGLSDRTL